MSILLKNITAILPEEGNGDSPHMTGADRPLRGDSPLTRVEATSDDPMTVRRKNIVKTTNIAIEGNRIKAIGDIPQNFNPERIIDGEDKLVIPGLINAHTHSYMSFMRGCGDDLAFMDWLDNRILPIEDNMTGDDAYWGACLGILEMIKSGTTCMNDNHVLIHHTPRAVKETGFRAFISRGIVGHGDDEDGARRIRESLEERDAFIDCDRLNFILAPHAPYSCDGELQAIIAKVAKKEGLGIHMHLAESVSEMEMIKAKYGCSPIELAERAGLLDIKPCIAVHCAQITEADADILAKHGVSVATNAASNMKLGNGFAPVPIMLRKGINVALGSDGVASNNSQSVFREMSLVSIIHKGVAKDPQCVSAEDVFNMATINGAKALGMENEIGSIEVGKKADLAILDLNSPSLNPRINLISALSYSANGQEVDTVIIDGRIVMEGRKLTTIDEAEVIRKVNESAKRLGIA